MTTIDLTPLYRTGIGFDHLASLLDSAMRLDKNNNAYPPYDIEALDEDRYAISLAVAGFTRDELDVQVENGVLTITGNKAQDDKCRRTFLHRGIADRAFERTFSLADYVEITSAKLANGLLSVELKRELPEAMKPKRIEIDTQTKALEHQPKVDKAA